MEPRIPDGSLNLFRLHPAGSRQNKILLIQRFGVARRNRALHHQDVHQPQGFQRRRRVAHEQIRLEPLNPEFEPWDVDPEDFAVVAEWLRVLE